MQSISPLTAAAHELKTPLTLISGLSHTLLQDEQVLTARQREYLERILLSSDRSLRMVHGLIDAYRLSALQLELPLEPVNIRQVIDDVAHELSPLSKKMQRQIVVQVRRPVGTVVAHRELLGDALYNLVENALRHGRGDDIYIGGRLQQTRTRLSVTSEGTRLSETEFSHLAKRLGTTAQPFAAQAGSSGLGLYIVRELITAMGGVLGLERQRIGTSFYLDLHTSTQLSLL